ncbi:MAG: aldehyde dehydrogenase family protein, partial [Dehalococcoidia bacterium]|nr:aldehyde dehydrogenase family protein [Dehalococcoidia bacterium]
MTEGTEVTIVARPENLERVGAELASKVAARRDELIDATSADLRFPPADMCREVDRAISSLRHLALAWPWIKGRAPICDPGESVALLLPYNLGALALQFVASLTVVGNPVTVRFSSRAPTLARLCKEILAAMALPAPVRLDTRPAREFLHDVLTDSTHPVLLAYGGHHLGEELLSGPPGTKIIFEGPGKDPLVVGHDADPKRVADILRRSKFSRCGQECIATERVVLINEQPDVLDAIVELATGLHASPDW